MQIPTSKKILLDDDTFRRLQHNLKITVALITKGCEPKRGNGVIPYINYIDMCSPKLHVEVNSFGLKKKGQADLLCKSNQRHLEPTLEYETTLPSPTNLKERIKMRSMHLYQTFSGVPPTHPHPHPHTHPATRKWAIANM